MPDLRQSIDDLSDLTAEIPLDIFDGRRGVFDDIVDQATRDRDRIELQFRQDLRDFDTVRDERIAVPADLPRVRLLAESIRAREQLCIESLRERLAAGSPSGNDVGERGSGHEKGAEGVLTLYRSLRASKSRRTALFEPDLQFL